MDMNFAASVEDSSMYLPINLSPSEDMFSTEGKSIANIDKCVNFLIIIFQDMPLL